MLYSFTFVELVHNVDSSVIFCRSDLHMRHLLIRRQRQAMMSTCAIIAGRKMMKVKVEKERITVPLHLFRPAIIIIMAITSMRTSGPIELPIRTGGGNVLVLYS